jgi:transposase
MDATGQTNRLESLPTDAESLRQMIAQLLADLHRKDREVADLRQQLEWFKRHVFGRRSEKLDPAQLALFEPLPPAVQAAPVPAPPPAAPPPKAGKHGRKPLPADLATERVECDLPAEQKTCACCGGALHKIGEEVTEELNWRPARPYLRQYVRLRYGCKACEGTVRIADGPARPIEKGRPGPSLLAHVIVNKYCDHLPLARQEAMFERSGIHLPRSNLCDWIGASAGLLAPVVGQMRQEILASPCIHTDDTTVPVQDRSRTSTRTGYLWAYLNDKQVVYDYTPTHHKQGPLAILKTYAGYVQADAYKGYDILFLPGIDGPPPLRIEVGCWAHARRKFHDARGTDPGRCALLLGLIQRLYAVEKEGRALTPEARAALRQQKATPILAEIQRTLQAWSIEVLPKSPVGMAVAYALGQWQALTRYPQDGRLAIDNNAAERALRGVAVGRNNWLFAGSDEGGRRAAILYSLIGSCKMIRVDPWAYLTDVLERISTYPARRIADLTPLAWKAARTRPA